MAPVCTVTVRGPTAAAGSTVIGTLRLVALVTLTAPTVIPDPVIETVVDPLTKLVLVPVMLSVPLAPWVALVGFRVIVTGVTVNTALCCDTPVVTVMEQSPDVAFAGIVTGAEAVVVVRTVNAPNTTPVQVLESVVWPFWKLVPVPVMLRVKADP